MRSRWNASMCLSCPAIRSSGAATSLFAASTAATASRSVKTASAPRRIMALRLIDARKSLSGITVATIQLLKFSGESVT